MALGTRHPDLLLAAPCVNYPPYPRLAQCLCLATLETRASLARHPFRGPASLWPSRAPLPGSLKVRAGFLMQRPLDIRLTQNLVG
jgi:hypothetical protein